MSYPLHIQPEAWIEFQTDDVTVVCFKAWKFEEESEHISLDSGIDCDGNMEGGYVNHTKGFGGRFTGFQGADLSGMCQERDCIHPCTAGSSRCKIDHF